MNADPLPLRRRRAPKPAFAAALVSSASTARSVEAAAVAADEAALARESIFDDETDASQTQYGPPQDLAQTVLTSHFRLGSQPEIIAVQRFLEEMASTQLTMTMRINELDRAVSAMPDKKATKTARQTLALRVAELDALRDTLNDLYIAAAEPEVAGALAHDGQFTEYLRGVYACAESAVRALSILATELASFSPDWFRLRARLNDARDFYLRDLEDEARASVTSVLLHTGDHPTARELHDATEATFAAASRVLDGLTQRFG